MDNFVDTIYGWSNAQKVLASLYLPPFILGWSVVRNSSNTFPPAVNISPRGSAFPPLQFRMSRFLGD